MRQQRDPPHQIGAVFPEHAAAGLPGAGDVVDELQKLREAVVGGGHGCGVSGRSDNAGGGHEIMRVSEGRRRRRRNSWKIKRFLI